jgi:hypothetical protein
VSSVLERTIPTVLPPFVGEVSVNFLQIQQCHVVSATDPYGSILGFLDRSRYFFFQAALSCTHEAEWTPIQTHYFSENLVAPGTERGPLDLYPGTLTSGCKSLLNTLKLVGIGRRYKEIQTTEAYSNLRLTNVKCSIHKQSR